MIAPATAVVSGGLMLWLAIASNDGLVSDDYYKQGLAINQVLLRGDRAAQLGYEARASISDDGMRVHVTFRSDAGSALPPTLQLRLAHPTRAGRDQSATLEQTHAGYYEARVAPSEQGRWQVSIEDLPATWRLTGAWQLPRDRAITLRALEPAAMPDKR